jgi:hypothetical protein
MSRTFRVALVLTLLFVCTPRAQEDGRMEERVVSAPLAVIAGKKRAALIVSRSLSVDMRGKVRGIISEVFDKDSPANPRHDYAYELASRRLQKYVDEYGSLTLVESVEEADFVIVFKVIREVKSFSPEEPFVYGEMFVFLNRSVEEPVPPLLWKTKDDHETPEDAVKEFVRQLKAVRGER